MPATFKTAIITGAGSGIGRAVAHILLRDGYLVGLIGRRTARLEETAAGHAQALVLPCDVTDPQAVDKAFSQAYQAWGRLGILFNNAGKNTPSSLIDEISVRSWKEVIEVNLTGAFLCARAAFRAMRHQTPQGGRIINNGSISASVPRPGSIAYSASKHAITGLTRSLSLDGRPFDIACGQIDIGNALTDMAKPMTQGVAQANGSMASEAVMDVENVATSVLHMANLPLNANVQFMTILATTMPFIGRG